VGAVECLKKPKLLLLGQGNSPLRDIYHTARRLEDSRFYRHDLRRTIILEVREQF
jgi:hypothetical protein